jgi:hypothetical protein
MKAYHFAGDKLRDGRPVPADGEWLEHDGPVAICESGLHASEHPFDALYYAPGFTLCLVKLENIVDRRKDKCVGRRRKILKRINAKSLVLKFARDCANDVLHLWDAPAVVRKFLQTGNNAAATATAYAAAATAATAAAYAAAATAATAAAYAAAATAATAAAYADATDAAYAAAAADATAYAGIGKYRKQFKRLVDEAFANA